MSLRFELLVSAVLTAAPVTYYTCPAGYRVLIKTLSVVNGDGAAPHTFFMVVVRSGVALNIVPINTNILANGQYKVADVNILLNPGDTIAAQASAATFMQTIVDGISQKLV